MLPRGGFYSNPELNRRLAYDDGMDGHGHGGLCIGLPGNGNLDIPSSETQLDSLQ